MRLGKDELKARFGCTERLAVRIGALLARGVGISAAAIEEACRTRELEAVFLSGPLLGRSDALETAALRALGDAASVLTVVVRDGRRIIALEEETLAEQAWDAARPASLPALVAPVTLAAPASPGAELRFSPEDLAGIRMVLLTGVDGRAKVEALRKLVYAPVDSGERGALALRAMADPDAEVRQEAAAALQRLGLDADLSDALRTVASGTPRQKAVALQKVASRTGRGAAGERSVALAMLASSLSYEKDAVVVRALLDALASCADLLGGSAEAFAPLGRSLVKVLADRLDDAGPSARALLDRVGAAGRTEVSDALWREVEGLSDRRLKTFFFEALCGMRLRPELESELCGRAAAELAAGAMDDLATRRLADALRLRGDAALKALLAALPAAREENRASLVGLIDDLACGEGVSKATRDEAGERFFELLRDGSRLVRTSIMEARCCWHPELGSGIKKKLAADFIGNLHAHRAPRVLELTTAALLRMGLDAVEPLQQCLAKSAYPVERTTAADMLAQIAAAVADRPGEVEAVVKVLRREEEGGRIPLGFAVRCVGRAASSPCVPPALAMDIYEDYWKRLSKVSYSFDVLAALGRLAAGKGCEPGAVAQLALKMLDLLESPMPDPTMTENKTDDGVEIVVGAQTVVYTDYIPELIAGVRGAFLSGRLRDSVRKSVVDRLCAKYEVLIEYREIWAPGNIVQFAEALGDLAQGAATPLPQRLQIIEALLRNVRNVTMVRILGRVVARPGEESKMFAALAGQFARRCLEMLGRPEYQEPEDQRAIVESLGRIAANRTIGESKKESEELRTRIVELLIEHREAVHGGAGLLRAIAAGEAVPKALRKRIEGALGP